MTTRHCDVPSAAERPLPPRWERQSHGWVDVCGYDDLEPERGVAALVDGEQVALFRTFDGMLHAIGNRDPFSGAYLLCRGIVGSQGDTPTVASPLFKQVFDLRTGRCLAEPEVAVPVHEVRRAGDRVEIRVRSA
jgi:nitrite reductase (NADH) small subunit